MKDRNRRYKCQQHQRETKYCCSDCNVILWVDCNIEGKHAICKKESVYETIKRDKSCLDTKLKEIFKASSSMEKKIDAFDYGKCEQLLDDTVERLKLSITKAIDKEAVELKHTLQSIDNSTKYLQDKCSEMLEIYRKSKEIMQSDS